jgi:hypothetical protein
MPQTTPAGREHSAAAFSFPAVRGKKVTAAFDGGRLTSDGGVLRITQIGFSLKNSGSGIHHRLHRTWPAVFATACRTDRMPVRRERRGGARQR